MISILILTIIFFYLGPRPKKINYHSFLPDIPDNLDQIDVYISDQNALFNIKKNNEAQIIWNNPTSKQKTDYCIIFLHGFSSSHFEGNPVHINLANKLNCNLLLTRLYGHGIETEQPLLDFTGQKLWNSALESFAIAKKIGKKVIIIGSSTGCTLGIKLASIFKDDVAALINYSPNIKIRNRFATLSNMPWGLYFIRLIFKGKMVTSKPSNNSYYKYWYYSYRCEAIPELQELVNSSMNNDTFKNITCPTLSLCYYKNEDSQDKVISIPAIEMMMKNISSSKKRFIKLASPRHHVISNYLKSHDVVTVEQETYKFIKEVL